MIGRMRYGHKHSFVTHVALAIALVLAAFTMQADRDTERATLTRLVEELDRLEPLIARAERESEIHDRVRFRYDWLRRDLDEVKSGVETFLNDTEFTPRTFEPLQGDYHQ